MRWGGISGPGPLETDLLDTRILAFILVFEPSPPSAHVHNYLTLTHTRGPSPLLAIGFSTVGALVASRSLPANPIGWLFCAVGFLFAVDQFADAVAHEKNPVRLCCTESDGEPRVYGESS